MQRVVLLLLLCGLGTVARAEDIVRKPSDFGVGETLDRLEAIVKEKGFTVFVRVDHAKGAESVGKSLPASQVLIFGNPRVGTELMSANAAAGLDLPIRVAAWEDAEGAVWVAYNAPTWVARRHEITERDDVVARMTGALQKLTDAATRAR